MSRFHTCRHCGCPGVEPDFRECSHCACLAIGSWVDGPNGPGEVVQVKHSGGFVVHVHGLGDRRYLGSELALQADGRLPGEDDEPAREPEPVPAAAPIAVDQVDQLEGLCPEQETRAAIRQLEAETETRLERIHRAARLELLMRPFPEWAFPQPR